MKSTAENFSQADIYNFRKQTHASYQHWLRVNCIAHEVLSIFVQKPGQKKVSILEIGCGEGRLIRYLSDYLTQHSSPELQIIYSGIDPSGQRIEIARKIFPAGAYFVNYVEDLPLKEKYDLIICSEVIEHVQNPDLLLEKTLSVMKNDGVLAMTTPNLLTWDNRLKKCLHLRVKPTISTHLREYDYASFSSLLLRYFDITRYYSVGFRLPLYGKLGKIEEIPFVFKKSFKLAHLFPRSGRVLIALARRKKS